MLAPFWPPLEASDPPKVQYVFTFGTFSSFEKNLFRCHLEGHSGPNLAPNWANLASYRSNLAPTWSQLGPNLAQLGPNLAYLGPNLAQQGSNLAQLGSKMAPKTLIYGGLVGSWVHDGPQTCPRGLLRQILEPFWSIFGSKNVVLDQG